MLMQVDVPMGKEMFSWSFHNEVAGNLLLTDSQSCSFNQFLKIMTGDHFELLPAKYSKLSQNFVSSSFAAMLMPKNELKKTLKKAEHLLEQSVKDELDKDYFTKWTKIHQFLFTLHRAKIDATALSNLMKELDAESSKTFQSFLPDSMGFAKKVNYSTSDTVTGRIKVSSGPQILTVRQDARNCIRSSFSEGSIQMIDFTSIEPRIALIEVGRQAPVDVYSELLEEFPRLSRDAAKLATLVSLYGGRVNRLAEIVDNIDDARKSVAFVRHLFKVDELERRLEKEAQNGVVRNAIGRPLREATKNSRIRTNHFLQSSAAEISILLFDEICEQLKDGLRPLFVIHDALIVDVRNDRLDELLNITNTIQWKGNKMPVKIECLWHT